MTKKQIVQLVEASYDKGALNSEKVDQVSILLKKHDLKAYIRAIKLTEKKKEVNIALPIASVYNTNKKIFLDLFPGKTVTINEDKLLMLGARVRADDMVYEFSLKNKLEVFLDELASTYDED